MNKSFGIRGAVTRLNRGETIISGGGYHYRTRSDGSVWRRNPASFMTRASWSKAAQSTTTFRNGHRTVMFSTVSSKKGRS